MNKTVFVDTAGLIALGDRSDNLHHVAVKEMRRLQAEKTHLVTTNLVLFEVGNAFSRSQFKKIATGIFSVVMDSDVWECVFIDESLTEHAIRLYNDRTDKDW